MPARTAKDVALPRFDALDAPWKQAFRKRLLAWYGKNSRDLPWRKSSDPYKVWVSEVMLQQTQVATVKAYFERFIKAFPTVEHLAQAEEVDVLKLWEGLGYYRRARGLWNAAKVLSEQHGGTFPRNVAGLMELPGIGRYTAGAILSIAFDERAPILEANTIRLFTRLVALREDPTKGASQRVLWQIAEEVLPSRDVAKFNQALMELGSLVCKPQQPACDRCPAESLCHARRLKLVEQLPASTRKMNYEDVVHTAVVVERGSRVLVRECGPEERWSGLWDFPRFELPTESPVRRSSEIVKQVAELTGIKCQLVDHFHTLKHGVTRFRITLDCYRGKYLGGRLRTGGRLRWVTLEELTGLPLSVTGRKIAKLLGAGAKYG